MERHWLKSTDEIRAFFSDFGTVFSFDFETSSDDIDSFKRLNPNKKVPENIQRQALNYYYLKATDASFCNGKKACYLSIENIPNSMSIIKEMFAKATYIIGHNIAYDIKVLHKYGIIVEDKKIYCTMVADHLLDEEREHGLKKLAHSILGKQEVVTYEEAVKAGGQTFVDYAMNDAIWTWELCMWQQSRLKADNLEKLFREIEMPFQFCIVDMEVNGFDIDLKKAAEISTVLEEAIEKFTIEMLEQLGERFQMQMKIDGSMSIVSPINFESPSQLAEICEKRLGLAKVEETDSGAYSVGKEFLLKYADHPFVAVLSKYKIASQLQKLFFKPLPELVSPDGKVRSHFKDTGTATGRLSCSAPNLQQLAKPNDKFPIETRSCFIAGKGRKLITADFSGQEICIMAEESKDENIINILLKNQDMHLKTARDAFGAPIPEEALSRDHPDYSKYAKQYKKERNKSKIFNFSLPYGKGAFGFSKDYGISEEEAQKILDNYFAKNPKLKLAIDGAKNEVERTGTVTYLSGRKRHFKKIKTENWEGYSKKAMRQAFNAKIQGFGADMMRIAMNNIRKAIKLYPQYDIKIHATVHDEVCVSCREEHVAEASKVIKECMQSSVKLCVPLLSDIGTGDDYSQAK